TLANRATGPGNTVFSLPIARGCSASCGPVAISLEGSSWHRRTSARRRSIATNRRAPGPERPRPPHLEDRLNRYVFHPLAARLARGLLPTGISPNTVSVLGMFLVWGA